MVAASLAPHPEESVRNLTARAVHGTQPASATTPIPRARHQPRMRAGRSPRWAPHTALSNRRSGAARPDLARRIRQRYQPENYRADVRERPPDRPEPARGRRVAGRRVERSRDRRLCLLRSRQAARGGPVLRKRLRILDQTRVIRPTSFQAAASSSRESTEPLGSTSPPRSGPRHGIFCFSCEPGCTGSRPMATRSAGTTRPGCTPPARHPSLR